MADSAKEFFSPESIEMCEYLNDQGKDGREVFVKCATKEQVDMVFGGNSPIALVTVFASRIKDVSKEILDKISDIQLARIAVVEKDYERAEKLFRKVIEESDGKFEVSLATYNLATLLSAKGDYEEAMGLYEKVQAIELVSLVTHQQLTIKEVAPEVFERCARGFWSFEDENCDGMGRSC